MEYALGALKNPKDNRDVQLTQVQAPIALPYKFITDISFIPVLNQNQLGACVGHTQALIQIYNELKENGKVLKLSPRYLYALAKKMDGLVAQGTYPRIVSGIQKDKGCATETLCLNDTTLSHEVYINVVETDALKVDAKPYKVKGYANVAVDKDAIKQAIVQNALMAATISVGNFDNPIQPGALGLHRVLVYGFEGDRFFYRNSWGEGWGDKGNGYFDWGQQQLQDLMVFVDLPNEILEDIKKKYQFFSQKEVDDYKLKPELWKLLDKMRKECGFAFSIESGLRTKEQNDALKDSVSDSAHLTGLAVDLRITDSIRRDKLVTVAKANGVRRIGIGKNFVHLDIDLSKPQDVMWHYYA